MELLKQKLQAFGYHALWSMFLISIYMALVLFVWYPLPFFFVDAGWKVNIVLILVDIVLGPVLTFVVFKPGKKGLKFDLTLIVVIQLAALTAGAWVTYSDRPVYSAFVVDRFELVYPSDFKSNEQPAVLKPFFQLGMAYVKALTDEERKDLTLVLADLKTFPDRYEPLEKYKNDLIARSIDLNQDRFYQADPKKKALWEAFIAKNNPNDYLYLPIKGRERHWVLVLERETLAVKTALDIDPTW
jgi:hypothetical protein